MAKYLTTTGIMCLLLLNNVHQSEQQINAILSIGKTVFDVAKFGLNIYNMLNGDDGNTEQIEQLKEDLSKKIDASTTTLIRNTMFVSKLERIDDAVIAIHSSLEDIRLMLSSSGTDRTNYENLFKKNYESSNLITHLRFLPSLLTYQIPGTSGALIYLWTDTTRCNMTSLYVFKQFYFDLVSSGIGLEATYNTLTTKTGISIQDTLEAWEPRIKSMDKVFETNENKCKSMFEKLIREDIRITNSPSELKKKLDQRYPYKIHDVYFLQTPGTYQLIYYESNDGLIIWEKVSDVTRLVVSIDLDNLETFRNVTGIDGEIVRSMITSEEDVDAAKHVSVGIKKIVQNFKGYVVQGLISYFDDFVHTQEFHKDSPVTSTEIKDVTLRYCHKTGFECAFIGKEEVRGNIKVFLYMHVPRTATNNTTTVKGSAPKAHMPSLVNMLVVGFITACFCSLLD